MLEMQGVSKRFRAGVRGCSATVLALDGLGLRVRAGERVGILGPPRSGKTTLLLCAAGLVRPDTGVIRWRGDRKRIALASDRDGLYAFLTAREALDHHITAHELPPHDREARIHAALARTGLTAVAECRLSLLPAGARRRVAIAQALLADPWLLLIDGTLDSLPRDDASISRAAIADTAAKGCAVLIGSQDPETLAGVALRTLVLRAPGAVVPHVADVREAPRLAAVSERPPPRQR